MKTTNLTFVFLFVATLLKAQSHILDDYIQQGLKNNLQLQQEQLNYERSMENLAQARALFMPHIGLNASYQFAQGGRTTNIPVGDLVNPIFKNLNAINGQLSIPVQYQGISNESIKFLADNFHDTKVRVIQPLFNPEIYFNYKAQKELITVQQAQKKNYENQLKYEIASAYFQFLQANDALKILNNTTTLLRELLKINQSLVKNAKATKDVVLSTEYELNKTEQQIAESQKNYEVAQAYFNFLLNRDLSSSIVKDSTLSVSLNEQQEISSLTNTALQQRQDLVQLKNGLEVNEKIVSLNKGNAYLPRINAVGDIGYQGYYYTFKSDQQYWLAQFSLTWDIFKGGEKRAKVQQARIDYQVMENKMEQLKKQIELQVIQSHYELQSAKQAYKASQSGVNSAEKSFQIIRAKYNEGQGLLIEYLDAENKFTNAQIQNSINQYELLRKAAALQKTISNL